MGRKRTGARIHGWVILDKPLGMSSAQAVAKVRHALGAAKAGHGGTLDPLATGVLPIGLGEATKLMSYVMDGAKRYRFRVNWGERRSTDDCEGEVVESSAARPDRAAIEAVMPGFVGDVMQIPPAYSAIKIAGQRAYALARAGEAAEMTARRIRIEHLTLLASDADWAEFDLECGKGTYVRSLARDLARELGTVGHLSMLRRTACGPFREADAISLDKLDGFGHSAAAANPVLRVETVLDDIPALALTEDEARRLRTGQSVAFPISDVRRPFPPLSAGLTVRAMADGRMVALARIENGNIRPVRVLNP
jgi:tRNA pseudouridine55 synthase